MTTQPSDAQTPGLLARLIAGERRASEIVAELDEPKPVSLQTRLQFELLTPEQQAVGFGLVAAERNRPDPSVSVAAKPPRTGNQNDWLNDAGSEPPQEFYRDKWLTGTMTELGYALRPVHLKEVGDRQLLKDFRKRAEAEKSLLWCRATQTDDFDVFLRHHEPRDENAVLKKLHDAEGRLTEYRKTKLAELNGTQPNQVRPKRR